MTNVRGRTLLLSFALAAVVIGVAIWANGRWISGSARNLLRLPGLAIPIVLGLMGLGVFGIAIGLLLQFAMLTAIFYFAFSAVKGLSQPRRGA
jgi:hypothetical protein